MGGPHVQRSLRSRKTTRAALSIALVVGVLGGSGARAAIVATDGDAGIADKPAPEARPERSSRLDDIIIYEKIALAWNNHISVLVRDPELRPYFTDKQPVPPSGIIRLRVLAYAEVRIDIADMMLRLIALAGSTPQQTVGWQNTVAVAFEESPAMCVVYRQHRKIYANADIQRFGDAACKP